MVNLFCYENPAKNVVAQWRGLLSRTSSVAPTSHVTPQVERLLVMRDGDMTRDQLQKAIGLQDHKSFRE